ncbi:hypothetical protein NL676_007124, partial [Syzygium grande]
EDETLIHDPASARFIDEPLSMATPPMHLQICDEKLCHRRQMDERPSILATVVHGNPDEGVCC